MRPGFYHVKFIVYIYSVIETATAMIEILDYDYPETPKRNKYQRGHINQRPQGYQPKIDYWYGQLNEAIRNLDPEAVEYASQKLAYFVGRQREVMNRLEQLYI